LRVFQGQALQAAARSQMYVGLPKDVEEEIDTIEAVPVEAPPGEVVAMAEPIEPEQTEAEPIPIDTTAELLGRVKARKPRARTLPRPAAEGRTTKKAAAKKPAARRTARAKKAGAADASADSE
jgi:hypothetical protein